MEAAKPVTEEGLSSGASPAGSSAGGSRGPPGGSGASTVHSRRAGDGSRLPAASTALTSKPWAPAGTSVSTFGEAQAAKAAASSRHSKVAPLSGDSKANVAVVAWTDPVGPEVIAVSGGVVSAGVAVAVGLAVAVADGPGVTTGVGVGVGGPIGGAGAVIRSARARQLLPSRRSRTRRAPSAHANSR